MAIAAPRTFWMAGRSNPIRIAMIAITTASSTRVKPACFRSLTLGLIVQIMFRFFINYFSFHQGSNEVAGASSEIIFGKLRRGWVIAAHEGSQSRGYGAE